MIPEESIGRLAGRSPFDVQAVAELDLQTRIDRKYLVDAPLLRRLLDEVGERVSILDVGGRRQFAYESVYFDTPGLDLYREAAFRRRRRFKVRTRTYDDTRERMLEVKTKDGRGKTVKHRMAYGHADRDVLDGDARHFVDEVTGRPGASTGLVPVLTTRYRRVTLVDDVARTRTTVDGEVVCIDADGRAVTIDRLVIETKSTGGASPVDHVLWQLGARPVRFSKCTTAQAMLDATLPSNRWHRTIGRHLT